VLTRVRCDVTIAGHTRAAAGCETRTRWRPRNPSFL
jgi:hypothetical protein